MMERREIDGSGYGQTDRNVLVNGMGHDGSEGGGSLLRMVVLDGCWRLGRRRDTVAWQPITAQSVQFSPIMIHRPLGPINGDNRRLSIKNDYQ